MEENKIEHINCSKCHKQITCIEDNEITADTHFDISRSNKEFEINNNNIEETEERNIKMKMTLCEECFLKVLNESKILGSLFLNSKEKVFIY